MDATPNLFDQPKPPSVAAPTSQAAAVSIARTAHTLRQQVLERIQRAGIDGATDDEIQAGLGMDPSTERPRRIELERAGKIVRTKRTRPTRAGKQAMVFVAREFAPKETR